MDAERKARMAELEARRKRLDDLKKRKAGGAGAAGGSASDAADSILKEITSLIDRPAPPPDATAAAAGIVHAPPCFCVSAFK